MSNKSLQDLFAEQTRLRNEMGGMQRVLRLLPEQDIPDDLRSDLKERVEAVLAITAEHLYHLSTTPEST